MNRRISSTSASTAFRFSSLAAHAAATACARFSSATALALRSLTAAIAETAVTIRSKSATAALNDATLRLRWHHRQSRSAAETGRARIVSPA